MIRENSSPAVSASEQTATTATIITVKKTDFMRPGTLLTEAACFSFVEELDRLPVLFAYANRPFGALWIFFRTAIDYAADDLIGGNHGRLKINNMRYNAN
eukprot:scaffold522660_cov44-Prasinocladus_malaysianus.AAC.1